MNIYQKLNRARTVFHSIELKKSGHNKFAGYKYFELGDFLVPALKVFSEQGLTSMVSFTADTATMTIIDVDKPEDKVVITSPMGSAALKGCHEVQNIGAVESYQRRYLWVAALEIVEHDAIDSQPPVEKTPIISATKGSPDEPKLSKEDMEFIDEFAEWAERVVTQGDVDGVVASIKENKLNDQQTTYLWSLLTSKTRAAIKKFTTTQKETA